MTSEQALRAINQAFPGKQAYVESQRWSKDGLIDNVYRFTACVYDVLPKKHKDDCGALSVRVITSLQEAVDELVAKRPQEFQADAELMFSAN